MPAGIPSNSRSDRECSGLGLSLDRLEGGRGGRIYFDSQLPGHRRCRNIYRLGDDRLVASIFALAARTNRLSNSRCCLLLERRRRGTNCFVHAGLGRGNTDRCTSCSSGNGYFRELRDPASAAYGLGHLGTATVLFIVALEIAVFGYVPGVSEQTLILHICWGSLAVALVLYLISIVSGFAHDIGGGDLISRG